MFSRKLLMGAVCASLCGHIVLLGIFSIGKLLSPQVPSEPVIVSLAAEENRNMPDILPSARPLPNSGQAPEQSSIPERQDTVELGNSSSRYSSYLKQIQKKIEAHWFYPDEAYRRNEEGSLLIRLSISATGNLCDLRIVSSSGYASLDKTTVQVIRSAFPVDPFPKSFHLSKLHVSARFRYRLRNEFPALG